MNSPPTRPNTARCRRRAGGSHRWGGCRRRGRRLELNWTENGGPPVVAPQRRGFGSMVIERNLARTLDAQVDLDFAAEGLHCRMVIPLTQFAISR